MARNEMKKAAVVETTPLNPETPQKATEIVRNKRARSPPLMASETMEKAPSNYEKVREETIKANMEKMRKLGLLSLSRDVQSAFNAPNSSTNHKRRRVLLPSDGSEKKVDLPPLLPPRRSRRLENAAPVDYKEISDVAKANKTLIEEGSREEFYTEEHEKLLGSCESPWTLFVDGYSKDGVRIYDPVKGKTCHQCRQKTMGYRTNCCRCQALHGQFCGDCLYMRYGENVLEAMKNPQWICPVCRGICNCSFCRQKKGWNPTGTLYRKIVNLGYKSVAHYLIQTHRKPANSDDSPDVNREQPKPENIPEKSDDKKVVVSAADDGESTAMCRRVKRQAKERDSGNVSLEPVTSRLRSCQKKARERDSGNVSLETVASRLRSRQKKA